MEKGLTHGKMDENTKDSTSAIPNTVQEFSLGQMDLDMKALS
jgi:hypothetical protein